jgi:hypothetical protein
MLSPNCLDYYLNLQFYSAASGFATSVKLAVPVFGQGLHVDSAAGHA